MIDADLLKQLGWSKGLIEEVTRVAKGLPMEGDGPGIQTTGIPTSVSGSSFHFTQGPSTGDVRAHWSSPSG